MKRVILAEESLLHKHLTNDGIDVWRMYTMATEVARTAHSRRQVLQPIEPLFERSSRAFHRYFFNCPAKRPVEKAICML